MSRPTVKMHPTFATMRQIERAAAALIIRDYRTADRALDRAEEIAEEGVVEGEIGAEELNALNESIKAARVEMHRKEGAEKTAKKAYATSRR
jgi:hypothetical protein